MGNDHSYIVYVKINPDGYIVDVSSSAFLTDNTGWTKLDAGAGDRYHHAQGHYFPAPVITDGGAYRYKLVDGSAVECTADEIGEQEKHRMAASGPTRDERISELEAQNEMLVQCILELSEIVYA